MLVIKSNYYFRYGCLYCCEFRSSRQMEDLDFADVEEDEKEEIGVEAVNE